MRGVPSSLSTTRVTNEYMIALHHTSRKYVGTSLKYWVCTRVNMCASIFELLCAQSLSCLTDMNFHVKETKIDYINRHAESAGDRNIPPPAVEFFSIHVRGPPVLILQSPGWKPPHDQSDLHLSSSQSANQFTWRVPRPHRHLLASSSSV